jgi:hypothetical protein
MSYYELYEGASLQFRTIDDVVYVCVALFDYDMIHDATKIMASASVMLIMEDFTVTTLDWVNDDNENILMTKKYVFNDSVYALLSIIKETENINGRGRIEMVLGSKYGILTKLN